METGKVLLCSIASMLVYQCAASAAVIASDDFNRADGNVLGATPVGGYVWQENEATGPGQARIDSTYGANRAYVDSRGSGTDPSCILQGLSVKDLDMSVVMQPTLNDCYFGGITYRRSSLGAPMHSNTSGGYSADVTRAAWDGTRYGQSVSLRWANSTVLAVAALPTAANVGTDMVLRVIANGDHHQVYVDGSLVIDYNETTSGRDVAGRLGLGTYYGNWLFDDFTVSEVVVPEPASLGALTLLGSLVRRGRRS